MSYNHITDFIGLWRRITGGVEKAMMPGLDWWVAAMARAGLINVVVSGTPPTGNEDQTAWFKPANPTYQAEGELFLWDNEQQGYFPATPGLFFKMLERVALADTGNTDRMQSLFDTMFGGAPGTMIVRGDTEWEGLLAGPGGSVLTSQNGFPEWGAVPLAALQDGLDDVFGAVRGSIIYRGALKWAALNPGTLGDVLTTSGAGADPFWGAAATSASLDKMFGGVQGSIIFRGMSVWQPLAPGTDYDVLVTHGAGKNPSWSGLSASLDTMFGNTTGSILWRSSTGWTALPPGTDGQILQMDGGSPKWVPGQFQETPTNPVFGIGSAVLCTLRAGVPCAYMGTVAGSNVSTYTDIKDHEGDDKSWWAGWQAGTWMNISGLSLNGWPFSGYNVGYFVRVA